MKLSYHWIWDSICQTTRQNEGLGIATYAECRPHLSECSSHVILSPKACVHTSVVQSNTRNRIAIPAAHTYIVEEDGGIAMAQLADLPSRLFHVLFGQSPERWRNRRQHISPTIQNQFNVGKKWMDVVLNTLKLWWLERLFWVCDGQITSGNKASEDN